MSCFRTYVLRRASVVLTPIFHELDLLFSVLATADHVPVKIM